MAITLQTKTGEFKLDSDDASETLLFRGLSAGLSLPYECATGTCGTCRARVMSGDVEMAWPEAPGASRLKRDKGDILLCQSHAKGECVLRVPSDVHSGDRAAAPHRINGRLEGLKKLTSDVVDFEVALEQPVAFAAGQFMVVTAPGLTGGRAYSMVNYAPETDRIRFVVKRKPGGGFSNWLFADQAEGAGISLFGPLGTATLRPGEDGDLVCITGGSGIAGIMSILDHATKAGHFSSNKGWLYFGVRTLADGFYLKELAGLVEKSGGALQVILALSDEAAPAASHPDYPSIQLHEGFVHEVAARGVKDFCGDLNERTIGFVAGPPPMVDGAIRVLLSEAKLPPSRIRYDKFS
ncbi:MAG: 2Fe-2S iron-sulfur cluster binding domain-containing protein [Alphaproteobacteria bacterium]|nr:2Fe-2S iron-sulfur cluster binding domain-containing protein [Alphaproteobacteria bacterium]